MRLQQVDPEQQPPTTSIRYTEKNLESRRKMFFFQNGRLVVNDDKQKFTSAAARRNLMKVHLMGLDLHGGPDLDE